MRPLFLLCCLLAAFGGGYAAQTIALSQIQSQPYPGVMTNTGKGWQQNAEMTVGSGDPTSLGIANNMTLVDNAGTRGAVTWASGGNNWFALTGASSGGTVAAPITTIDNQVVFEIDGRAYLSGAWKNIASIQETNLGGNTGQVTLWGFGRAGISNAMALTVDGNLQRVILGTVGQDNNLAFVKSGKPAVAPGANVAQMRWIAGTNPGTCKLVASAGISATEVTIADNVGNGC